MWKYSLQSVGLWGINDQYIPTFTCTCSYLPSVDVCKHMYTSLTLTSGVGFFNSSTVFGRILPDDASITAGPVCGGGGGGGDGDDYTR